MDDNQTNNNEPSSKLSEQYQSILDKYAQELAVPAPPQTPSTPPEISSAPPEIPSVLPEMLLPPSEIPPTLPEEPVVTQSKSNNLFKIIFFISLFIFLGVLIANIYAYFMTKPSGPTTGQPTLIPNPTANIVNYCELNDVRYVVDQTFPAQDSCNTCTCLTDLTISCTNNVCPTAIPTSKSASPSAKPTIKPVPLTVSSVYPASGKIDAKITLYGTGFSKTGNNVVFTSTDSCSFTFGDLPSTDGQKISLQLTKPTEVNCTPNELVAGSYDVSVKVASASSYTNTKPIKFTIK